MFLIRQCEKMCMHYLLSFNNGITFGSYDCTFDSITNLHVTLTIVNADCGCNVVLITTAEVGPGAGLAFQKARFISCAVEAGDPERLPARNRCTSICRPLLANSFLLAKHLNSPQ